MFEEVGQTNAEDGGGACGCLGSRCVGLPGDQLGFAFGDAVADGFAILRRDAVGEHAVGSEGSDACPECVEEGAAVCFGDEDDAGLGAELALSRG